MLVLPRPARADVDECVNASRLYRAAYLKLNQAFTTYNGCASNTDVNCGHFLQQVQVAQSYLIAAGEYLGLSCLASRKSR
jgi:hypothetical protein